MESTCASACPCSAAARSHRKTCRVFGPSVHLNRWGSGHQILWTCPASVMLALPLAPIWTSQVAEILQKLCFDKSLMIMKPKQTNSRDSLRHWILHSEISALLQLHSQGQLSICIPLVMSRFPFWNGANPKVNALPPCLFCKLHVPRGCVGETR